MDVYLLAFDDYKASLPPLLREDLEPLRAFLRAHHAQEQKALARALGGRRFRELLQAWRAFLEAPVPAQPEAPEAARPVKAVADQRIWRMYRRVLREGRAIGEGSPAEDLHELRKSCKKLRYLMEFFDSLYTPKKIRSLIKILKVLLDNLGNFQDLEVQAQTLRGFAEQMVKEGTGGPDTLLAMGALIGGLSERQQEARRQFARIFAGFDTKEHLQSFKELFKAQAAVPA
jgi:CHAD domain-containing protein